MDNSCAARKLAWAHFFLGIIKFPLFIKGDEIFQWLHKPIIIHQKGIWQVSQFYHIFNVPDIFYLFLYNRQIFLLFKLAGCTIEMFWDWGTFYYSHFFLWWSSHHFFHFLAFFRNDVFLIEFVDFYFWNNRLLKLILHI